MKFTSSIDVLSNGHSDSCAVIMHDTDVQLRAISWEVQQGVCVEQAIHRENVLMIMFRLVKISYAQLCHEHCYERLIEK